MKFFSTRSSQCSAGVFSASMLMGSGISAYFSIILFKECADTVKYLDQVIDETLTLPSIEIVTDIQGYEIPISLKNVKIALPEDIIQMIHNSTETLPDYCYYVSITVLMIFTLSIALSLAACASNPSCSVRNSENETEDFGSTQILLGGDLV